MSVTRSKNYVPVNELTYGNLIESIPPIPVSSNGVHYNPYKGKKRTFENFGRGTKGDEKAQEAQWQWLMNLLEKYNWAVPDAIDTPETEIITTGRNDSSPMLLAGYVHPTFGQIGCHLKFPVPDYYGNKTDQGQIDLDIHPLAYLLAARGNVHTPTYSGRGKNITITSDSEIPDLFKKDPIGLAVRHVLSSNTQIPAERLLEVIQPPDFTRVPYKLFQEPVNGIWAQQRNHADLYRNPEATKEATFKGMKVLERALKAFEYLGANLRISQDIVGNEYVLSGLHLTIPADGEHGNEMGHTIDISTRGISVSCGYVQDDEKHRSFQMREARKFLEGIQEYETTSFKIERPTEGEE